MEKANKAFAVLGLKTTATEKEIKKAFRAKARGCHPDKNPNDPQAEEEFKNLNEAYTTALDYKENPKRYTSSNNPFAYGSYAGRSSQSYSNSYFVFEFFGQTFYCSFDDLNNIFGGFQGYSGNTRSQNKRSRYNSYTHNNANRSRARASKESSNAREKSNPFEQEYIALYQKLNKVKKDIELAKLISQKITDEEFEFSKHHMEAEEFNEAQQIQRKQEVYNQLSDVLLVGKHNKKRPEATMSDKITKLHKSVSSIVKLLKKRLANLNINKINYRQYAKSKEKGKKIEESLDNLKYFILPFHIKRLKKGFAKATEKYKQGLKTEDPYHEQLIKIKHGEFGDDIQDDDSTYDKQLAPYTESLDIYKEEINQLKEKYNKSAMGLYLCLSLSVPLFIKLATLLRFAKLSWRKIHTKTKGIYLKIKSLGAANKKKRRRRKARLRSASTSLTL